MKTYLAKQLFDGEHIHSDMLMQVDKGKIIALRSQAEQERTESKWQVDSELNGLVSAGFIDLQVNGGGGALFNHEQSPQALRQMVLGHAKYGTTAMLPTLITDNSEKMQKAADAVAEAIAITSPGIVGIHFEGPHLSLAKKGIHSAEQVRPMSDTDFATVTRRDIGKVMITVAPENVPPDVIKDLIKHNVVVSLGHSNANIDTVVAAIDAGAHAFTHLFNAMSGLSARSPGMIAAALSDSRVNAGLIADLHHVDTYNCKLAYQCIGPKRLMLVTDAMAHVGSEMKTLPWLDSEITRVGSKLTLADGSIAGSCLDMAGAVKNMLELLSKDTNDTQTQTILQDVLNMASATPAALMGLNTQGQLKVGFNADFVLLDQALRAKACWINGEQIAQQS
jgi:N-acetylglucosamine-6-phosphate deacetylase